MKTELLNLNLSPPLVDQILDIFDAYEQMVERHDKPKGRIAFRDNMAEIESLSRKLKKKLQKLTTFEKQLLIQHYSPNTFDIGLYLGRLEIASHKLTETKERFSRKQPFMLNLADELRGLLESHEIHVTKYRNNMLCRILNILFDEPEDSEKSFNLVREILNSKTPS